MLRDSELFKQIQTATISGIQPDTLSLWCRRGWGPRWVRINRRILFPGRDLPAYIRSLPTGGDAPKAEAGG